MPDGRWRDVLLVRAPQPHGGRRTDASHRARRLTAMARATVHVLLAMRRLLGAVARSVPRLRGMEHARRGARATARAGRGPGRRRTAAAGDRGGAPGGRAPSAAQRSERAPVTRMSTGIGELDRVLGGGLVPGSLVLLGGSPGIGKSTLTNMVLGHLQRPGARTLYVSGEESAEQVRLRAERLGAGRAGGAGPRRDRPRRRCSRRSRRRRREACVIDSVQTLRSAELVGRARLGRAGARGRRRGSWSWPRRRAIGGDPRRARDQGRGARGPARARASRRLRAAVRGRARAPLPRAARAEEPLRLDERGGRCSRCARAGSSRCSTPPRGSSAEATRAPGSVVLAAMEGSRPLLVEVQALVAPSELEQPRRVVSGLDRNRLALVLAILGRHGRDRHGRRPTCSSTSSGACAWTSPDATSRWRWPWPAPARGVPLRRLAAGLLRRARADGRDALGGPPRAAPAEAAKHGLDGVIAPADSGAEACQVATLREALAAALPSGRPEAARGGPAIAPARRWLWSATEPGGRAPRPLRALRDGAARVPSREHEGPIERPPRPRGGERAAKESLNALELGLWHHDPAKISTTK